MNVSTFFLQGCSVPSLLCLSPHLSSLSYLPSSLCAPMFSCLRSPWLFLGWQWGSLTPLLIFNWWPSIRGTLLFSYRWRIFYHLHICTCILYFHPRSIRLFDLCSPHNKHNRNVLQKSWNSRELSLSYNKGSCVFGSCFYAFLQALHFFIGFGALVSPLIADPFLSETGCGNHTENASETIHHFRNMLRNSPIVGHNINQSHMSHEDSNVQYAFWIMALINVRRHPGRCCCSLNPDFKPIVICSPSAAGAHRRPVPDVPGTADPMLSQRQPPSPGQRWTSHGNPARNRGSRCGTKESRSWRWNEGRGTIFNSRYLFWD